ncbi:MAG: DUF1926 domain-containing protein, partial [bacterium]|nr:DUF1926 domain-containing protein [bacterium]
MKRLKIRRIGTVHYGLQSEKPIPDPESPILITGQYGQWTTCLTSGQIISAGSMKNKIDVIDVLARRPEAYHSTMVEASDPRAGIHPESIHDMVEVAPVGWSDGHGYDKSQRGCFADRVVKFPPTLDQLAKVAYDEEAGPASGFWEIKEAKAKKLTITNDSFPWHREKIFDFEKDGRVAKMKYSLSR